MTVRIALLLGFALPPTALLFTAAPGQRRAASSQSSRSQVGFERDVAAVVKRFCIGCHNANSAPAGVKLTGFHDAASVIKARDLWERVARNVSDSHMPPPGVPHPTQAERDRMSAWIEAALSNAAGGSHNPGRVTMRRLNREEYNNTIRDLFGLDLRPADEFPSDDVGYGFDNIGDVLSISPLLMEKVIAASEKVAQAASRRILPADMNPRITAGERASITPVVLANFARRAWRRPVTKAEVARLVRIVGSAEREGESYERGIQLAVQTALVSPYFLFRVEADPNPSSKTARTIGQYEMASRLSYFLWSSMPDAELFALAARGRLQNPMTLAAQARRMLKDPKARALTQNFAGQWLQLRNLNSIQPDSGRFPSFDNTLRSAMRTETEMFFESVVKDDRSILDFVDARYSFLNERLAKHYGIPGVRGEAFQKVILADNRRGGLLTQASILTVTSNPTRTSPVKRGKWVLEQLLGAPPPPPPPNVPTLKDDRGEPLKGTLRQRMEQHRKDPACAPCHVRMDPLGFGLENFDVIGAWRDMDGGQPIDASGKLPDGSSFNGPAQLKTVLIAKKEQFARCLSGKLLTYALGRGLEPFDRNCVESIVKYVTLKRYRFSALITAIVQSEPFRKRGGGGRQ